MRIVSVEGYVDTGDTVRDAAKLLGPLTGNMHLLLISFWNNGVEGPFTAFSFSSAEGMRQLAGLTASVGFRNTTVK